MSRIRSLLFGCLCVALAGGCSSTTHNDGGIGGGGGNPPRIVSFTATPPLISPGGFAVLTWTATDVDAAALSPGVGAVTGTAFTVSPETTTLYTLTVSNSYGTDSAQATVVVERLPCTEGLACTPTTPCHEGRTTCENAIGVCLDTGESVADGTGCGTGVVCKAGSCVPACAANVACLASPCVNGLTSCATPVSAPVCLPASNAPDGTSCGAGNVCSAGACVAPLCTPGDPCQPANPCQLGTMACTSAAMPGTCSPGATQPDGTSCGVGLACVSGVCTGAPTIRSFTATPDNIGPGGSSTLAWDVAGATAVAIGPGIGVVTGTSRAVAPTGTTTYTLTASNSVGSTLASVTVTYSTISSVVMPDPFTMEAGTSVVLTPRVTVTGTPSIEMTWSLGQGSLGTVSPTRGISTLYTAPSQAGVYRVYATSVWDPTKWDNSVITVTPAPAPNTWRFRASLSMPRSGHSATLLNSGKVLVAGGFSGGAATASAEVYDPATNTWQPTGPMTEGRSGHAAALLSSGRVLIVGGKWGDTSAEVYDPGTNAWTSVGSTLAMHESPTATVLASGQVLVLGAAEEPLVQAPGIAEIFDPASGLFTSTDDIPVDRVAPSATILRSGKVLVSGGLWDEGHPAASAAIFDPAAPAGGRWSETGSMALRRWGHGATSLRSGNVLVSGGLTGSEDFWSTDSVEIYEVPSASWVPAGRMSVGRSSHTVTLLPSGRVLFVGGRCWWNPVSELDASSCPSGPFASAEYYDPAADSWAVASPMAIPRSGHAATLLPSGKVLVVGGSSDASVEEYTP